MAIEGRVDTFADALYRSAAWKRTRRAYLNEHPLCERCLAMGLIEAATEVHHKIVLTRRNINDPKVCFAFENLEALSDGCHKERHREMTARKHRVDAEGHVVIEDKPPR